MTDQPADPLAELDRALKPYRGELPTHARLPEQGVPREEVLAQLERMADAEREKWQGGHVSGAVYEGEPEHIAFLNEAYALHSQSNPLHLDVWPSAAKLEAEIVQSFQRWGSSMWGDLATRAYTLFEETYGEVRAAAEFVFRNDPAKLVMVPSMFVELRARARAKGEGSPPAPGPT